MLDSYATLGCTEVWNHARLDAYVAAGIKPRRMSILPCGCPTLGEALGETYTTPEVDGAPWYDADVPESAGFAGLLVLSITGLDDSPVTRSVRQGIGNGGIIGRPRYGPRYITVRGLLIASTCCAAQYGMAWLVQAAQGCGGAGCGSGACGGDTMEVLTCCPDSREDDECEGEGQEPLPPDPSGDDLRRCLKQAAVIDGPRVVDEHGSGCGQCGFSCATPEVEFTIAAGEPWYHTVTPRMVLACEPFGEGTGAPPDGCVEFCSHNPLRFADSADTTTGWVLGPGQVTHESNRFRMDPGSFLTAPTYVPSAAEVGQPFRLVATVSSPIPSGFNEGELRGPRLLISDTNTGTSELIASPNGTALFEVDVHVDAVGGDMSLEFEALAGEGQRPWLIHSVRYVYVGDDDCTDCVNADGRSHECDSPSTCAVDPCSALAAPPSFVTLQDECAGCEPLERTDPACYFLDGDLITEWFDALPVVTIYSGDRELRNVRVSFQPNPRRLPCDEVVDLDPCSECLELNVSYMPARATLTIDGTTRQATIECRGREAAPANHLLYGSGGTPFEWPTLTCGTSFCVCVSADANAYGGPHEDACISVELIGRGY